MIKRGVLTALGIGAALLGLYLLVRVFRRYDFAQVLATVAEVPLTTVARVLICAAVSYGLMAAMEHLALRYAGRKVAPQRILRTTTAALGIGKSIGLAFLSSGAVRYRMYSRVGLDLAAVGKVIAFCGVNVALGFACAGGLALLWRGNELALLFGLSPSLVHAVAVLALALTGAYMLLCAATRRIRLGRVAVRLPTPRIALGQVAFSALNVLCVGAALFFALRALIAVDYPTVAALYAGADVAGVIGHVPGGWGVLEYAVTHALDRPEVLSGILVYRAAYYLLPLCIGLALFAHDEWSWRHRARAASAVRSAAARGRG